MQITSLGLIRKFHDCMFKGHVPGRRGKCSKSCFAVVGADDSVSGLLYLLNKSPF